MADQLQVSGFSIEDEDRADFSISDIELAFGIDRHAVRRPEAKRRVLGPNF